VCISFSQPFVLLRQNAYHTSQVHLSNTEVASFDDTIRLFPTNQASSDYNHLCQRLSKQPIFKAVADHSDDTAARASPQEAGLLEPYLELSIGCKLMILENIWTERGIVNGTQSRLFDIVWAPDSDPNKDNPDPPLCLLVGIPKSSYDGPTVEGFTWREAEYAVVPIYRS
jgi:ATP-dependent DNA helicase PIF1